MKLHLIYPKSLLTVFLIPFLISCGNNETQTKSPLPTSVPSTPSVPSPQNTVVAKPEVTPSPPDTDSYQDAISKAIGAATITQSAQSQNDWSLIVGMWQGSINLMETVPKTSPNYASAQNKIKEYQGNLKFAQQMALKPIPTEQPTVIVQTSVSKPISQTVTRKPPSVTVINIAKKVPTSKPSTTNKSNVVKKIPTSKPSTTNKSNKSPQVPMLIQNSTHEASVRKFMEGYFDDTINKGYSGTASWCASSSELASSLFSPESGKILQIFANGQKASVTTRIESSNKGGMPIRHNWEFYLEKGDTVIEKKLLKEGNKSAYQDLKNKNAGWCILLMSE